MSERGSLWLAILAAAVPLIVLADSIPIPLTGDDYLWFQGVRETPVEQMLDFDQLKEFTFFQRPVRFAFTGAILETFGPIPEPFRIAALILHSANAVMLFFLARRLGLAGWAALLASLVFSLHHRASQSVLWVAANAECLAMTFVLGGLHSLVSFLRSGKARWFVATLSLLLLALLSKESAYSGIAAAIVLPVVAGAALESTWKRRALASGTLLILALANASFQLRHSVGGEYGRGPAELAYTYLRWMRTLVGLPDGIAEAAVAIVILCALVPSRGITRWCALWVLLAPLPYVTVYVGFETRFYYQVFAPIGLMAGASAVALRFPARGAVLAGVGALLVFFVVQQRTLLAGWRSAGELAEKMLASAEPFVDEMRAAKKVTYVDLPVSSESGWVYNAGFDAALAMRYGLDRHKLQGRALRKTILGLVDFTPPGVIEPEPLTEPLFSGRSGVALERIRPVDLSVRPEIHPYLFAVTRTRTLPDEKQRGLALIDPDFDPREEAILTTPVENLPGDEARLPYVRDLHIGMTIARARIEAPDGAVIVWAEPAVEGGFLFLVNGEARTSFPVDEIFHGVVVGPGTHEVEVRGDY